MIMRRVAGLLALAALLALPACSSSDAPVRPPTTTPVRHSASPPAPSPSSPARSSATLTSDEQAAMLAYRRYFAAVSAAERDPAGVTREHLAKFAVDPLLSSISGTIAQLQVFRYAYKGSPPRPRLQRPAAASTRSGRRTIVFSDCPMLSNSWRVYSQATGKPAKQVAPKVPPPYASSIEVVQTAGAWRVRQVSVDASQTCHA